ncbi:MAG: MerR family transcriptional regulator [Muribaculaceae bacterium]|nr:MerR family transcriptional regulator [Muribaculaceae bacterium]
MASDLTKKYYKIKDAAEILNVSQPTLRYWESEFPEIRPLRSTSNQRYYTPDDIETLRIIYYLVKVRGLKIEAAREQMRLNRKNITKRMDVIDKLLDVRDELEMILKGLEKRR